MNHDAVTSFQQEDHRHPVSLSDQSGNKSGGPEVSGTTCMNDNQSEQVKTNRDRTNTDISDVTMVEMGVTQTTTREHTRNMNCDVKPNFGREANASNVQRPPKLPKEPPMLRFSSSGSNPTDTETDGSGGKSNTNDNDFPKFYDSDGDNSHVYDLSPTIVPRDTLSVEPFDSHSRSVIDDESAISFLPRPPMKSNLCETGNVDSNMVNSQNNESSISSILVPKKGGILPYHLRKKLNEASETDESSKIELSSAQSSISTPPLPQKENNYQRKYMNFPKIPDLDQSKSSNDAGKHAMPRGSESGRYQRRYMQFPPTGQKGSISQPVAGRLGLPPSGNRSRTNSNDNPTPPIVANRTRSYSGDKGKPSNPPRNSPVQKSIKQRPLNQVDMLGMPQPKLRPIDNRVRKGSFDANGPLLRRVRSSSIDSGCESDGSYYRGSGGGGAVGLAAKLADDVKQFLKGGEEPTRKVEDYGSIKGELASEFHRQNQDFLKYVQLEQNRYAVVTGNPKPLATWGDIQPIDARLSPVRSHSPRPPNTRGQHRAGLRKF